MPKADILTLHSVLYLLYSPNSLYLLGYAFLFGMCES